MNKTSVEYIAIDEDQADQRIDNFLISKLKNVPKSHIYRLLRKGEVRVNKKRIKPEYRLKNNDLVRVPPVTVPEQKTAYKPSANLIQELQDAILFETDEILILNKPVGIPVHGGSGISGGVIEILRAMKPEYKKIELAHRIDKDTSGCLLLAKKRSILKVLHDLFRQQQVHKAYLALAMGRWPDTKHTVDLPLVKNQLASGERMVKVSEEGKQSVTHFKVLENFAAASLLEATLETGRSHQIRVHTAAAQHPLAGDPKYGDKAFNRLIANLGCKRMFLHAYELQFSLPNGQNIVASAPLPAELEALLERLRKPITTR